MPFRPAAANRHPPIEPSLILFTALFGVLWLAGGASHVDVLGQVVVQAGTWTILVAGLLFCRKPALAAVKWPALIVFAAVVVSVLHLIPLPPGVWQTLPGRSPFAEAARLAGEAQPWRPLAIVPGAAFTSATSLVVPIATLLLLAAMPDRSRAYIPAIMLSFIVGDMFIGLLQFSGSGLHSPLVNGTPGQVSGLFANRNHFSLFLAMGCVLAPLWATRDSRPPSWKLLLAFALLVLLTLTILGTGSRAGVALGALALGFGIILAKRKLWRRFRHLPRWAIPATLGAAITAVLAVVLVSVLAGRAVSIARIAATDSSQDMRSRAMPTMLQMLETSFPFGTGFGSFDAMFRMHEPLALLKPTYFNHAHNDYLEVVLEGGLPALLLLIGAIGWFLLASIRAWRRRSEAAFARLGSVLILLVLLASAVDYPARTPLMMAIVTIASFWLTTDRGVAEVAATNRLRDKPDDVKPVK